MPRETPAKSRRKPLSASSEPVHARIEMRWDGEARELEDLAKVAKDLSGNPTRRGEAGTYIVRLWSRVLHGELSPGAFWEMFGVTPPTPPPPYPMMMMPGMYPPGMPSPTPPVEPPPAEDPEEVARKRQRVRNRAAVAEEWGG